MYFYVLNFVFKFLNFVKINIKKKKIDADMVFIIIIIILPCQRLACYQYTSFAISDFSVTMLKVETKIKMIFFFFKSGTDLGAK